MLDALFNYYGVDWLAMALTFVSIYQLGRKNRSGFIYGLGANAAWFTFGIMAGSVANPVANIIFAGLNIKGFSAWSKETPID